MRLLEKLNVIDSKLNVDLLNKNELWVSVFDITYNEDNPEEKIICSIKPTKVKLHSRLIKSKEIIVIKVTGIEGRRSFYAEFTCDAWLDDNSGKYIASGFVENRKGKDELYLYMAEFFENRLEAENYYNNNVKKYVKKYEDFTNTIRGYKIS